ncbi:hypothetical protein DFH06DRAFT_1317078 [Mycena polygramma]|nr:hypothetical protein DFH06DRAFT_1317078 [Mycena polygramma]
MPLPGKPHCVPPYWAEPGKEDLHQYLQNGGKIYVVGNGRRCGIFPSEIRARKQIEGYPNGRWRKAKTWSLGITIWNEYCDVFHENGCPPHPDRPDFSTPTIPTSSESVRMHNSNVVFRSSTANVKYKSTPVTEAEAHAFVASGSAPPPNARRTFVAPSPALATPARTRYRPTAPPSPLDKMDPVEAFSRMGLAEPSVDSRPPKQWVIAGVNRFFATRVDAIDHIWAIDMERSALLGSRNIHKLRAFARGEEYIPRPGETEYADDE